MGTAAGGAPFTGTLMTVAEVAGVLRVSTMTVYRLVRSGELPAIRVGKSFRIQQHDLTAYLAEGVVRADHSNG
jgi:excisionase family DNA binding protein